MLTTDPPSLLTYLCIWLPQVLKQGIDEARAIGLATKYYEDAEEKLRVVAEVRSEVQRELAKPQFDENEVEKSVAKLEGTKVVVTGASLPPYLPILAPLARLAPGGAVASCGRRLKGRLPYVPRLLPCRSCLACSPCLRCLLPQTRCRAIVLSWKT